MDEIENIVWTEVNKLSGFLVHKIAAEREDSSINHSAAALQSQCCITPPLALTA